MASEWQRDDYLISTDPARLDLAVIHGYLTRSYWAAGIPFAIVARSLQRSLNFGLYHDGQPIGFARLVTDYATYAYVADVFVLEEHRGRGLGKWLMATVAEHPDLADVRRWQPVTRDAHGLYEQSGFRDLTQPERHMEKVRPNPYQTALTNA